MEHIIRVVDAAGKTSPVFAETTRQQLVDAGYINTSLTQEDIIATAALSPQYLTQLVFANKPNFDLNPLPRTKTIQLTYSDPTEDLEVFSLSEQGVHQIKRATYAIHNDPWIIDLWEKLSMGKITILARPETLEAIQIP